MEMGVTPVLDDKRNYTILDINIRLPASD